MAKYLRKFLNNDLENEFVETIKNIIISNRDKIKFEWEETRDQIYNINDKLTFRINFAGSPSAYKEYEINSKKIHPSIGEEINEYLYAIEKENRETRQQLAKQREEQEYEQNMEKILTELK